VELIILLVTKCISQQMLSLWFEVNRIPFSVRFNFTVPFNLLEYHFITYSKYRSGNTSLLSLVATI